MSTEEISLLRLQQAASEISAGNLKKAETILTSVLAGRPRDPDTLNLLGVVRAQQNRTAEAERLLRRAVAISPTHVGAYINLAELYVTMDRPQRAMQMLLAGHKLAPARPDINLKLAGLYGEAGNYQLALEYLRLIPREAASAAYLTLLLKTLLKLNRLEEARQLVRELMQFPGDISRAIVFSLRHHSPRLDRATRSLEKKRSRLDLQSWPYFSMAIRQTGSSGFYEATGSSRRGSA
ncbi:MAG TPA: tetratricopeptide repeat protein [Pyrinomonadaceae bacterium]|nr:tetratricopeptide repeat protein [Pyrinomonadaceae bacterium]